MVSHHNTPQSGTRALWLLGGASLLLYGLIFVIQFPLGPLVEQAPPLSWSRLASGSLAAGVRMALAWGALFILYWQAVQVARQVPWHAARVPLVTVSILAGLLLAAGAYPGGAIDIYTYVAHTRLFLAGFNPFLTPPEQVHEVGNILPYLGEWRGLPSPYGPLMEILALVPGGLGGRILWREIVAFKLWNLAAFVGLLVALQAALRARAPEQVAGGMALVAWNPLLLVEIAANGHNDSWLIFAMTAALWAWATRRWLFVLPLLAAGIALKWIPLIVTPLFLMEQRRSRRGRLLLFSASLLSAAIIAASFAPVWTTVSDLQRWPVVAEGERLGFSWHTLALLVLQTMTDGDTLVSLSHLQAARLIGYVLFGVVWLWAVQGLRRGRVMLPQAVFWVLVGYVSLGAPSFRPWYALWPLTAAALAVQPLVQSRAAFFTAGTALAVVLYDFGWPILGRYAVIALHLVGVPLTFAGLWLPQQIIVRLLPLFNLPRQWWGEGTQERPPGDGAGSLAT